MAYSEKDKERLISIICDRVEKGESLRNILKDKDMPKSPTFYEWIDDNDKFSKQYARAKEIFADREFEQILAIADATADDIILDEDGNEIANHNVINRDRLRIDARKWRLSKMLPKKYGDKQEVNMNMKIGKELDEEFED